MLLKNLTKRYYRGGYFDFFRRFQSMDDVFDKQLRLMERDFERFRRSMFSDMLQNQQKLPTGETSEQDLLAKDEDQRI